MNDLIVTVTGWVATEPRHVVGPSGTRLTSFRLASTSRYFDRAAGAWADGATEWFTVRAFRGPAITVKESVAKGQPVVVHGRLRTHTWQADDGERTELQIDAIAVGHDLTRGVATFTRATGDPTLGEETEETEETEEGEVNADDETPIASPDPEIEQVEPSVTAA